MGEGVGVNDMHAGGGNASCKWGRRGCKKFMQIKETNK